MSLLNIVNKAFKRKFKDEGAAALFLFDLFSNANKVSGKIMCQHGRLTDHWFECEINSFDIPRIGIYFLMLFDYVVYVGMSKKSIYNRIFPSGWGLRNSHSEDKNKLFDSFKVIELTNDDYVLDIEKFYIDFFNPPQNSSCKNGFYNKFLPKKYISDSRHGMEMEKLYWHLIGLEAIDDF